ncbi:YtrH family sporulation protein [Desulfotomaculum sp. 1211_IL3151]|uniref:YtrH family sporulation protein n=1 Tax=Desulfotomaculum sp. 1211_IL3151 TaxID=3084055 RepID=UPI002FDB4D02
MIKIETFEHKVILIFFTALGIMLGSVLIGSLAALLVREPSLGVMLKLSRDMKIWAIAAAIGGTFSTFEVFESGLFNGEVRAVIKQIFYIVSALAGTQAGYYLILTLCGANSR